MILLSHPPNTSVCKFFKQLCKSWVLDIFNDVLVLLWNMLGRSIMMDMTRTTMMMLLDNGDDDKWFIITYVSVWYSKHALSTTTNYSFLMSNVTTVFVFGFSIPLDIHIFMWVQYNLMEVLSIEYCLFYYLLYILCRFILIICSNVISITHKYKWKKSVNCVCWCTR